LPVPVVVAVVVVAVPDQTLQMPLLVEQVAQDMF
jgi:hypothetical protein